MVLMGRTWCVSESKFIGVVRSDVEGREGDGTRVVLAMFKTVFVGHVHLNAVQGVGQCGYVQDVMETEDVSSGTCEGNSSLS